MRSPEPAYPYRGMYLEDSWGQDLMELQDWREAIDYYAGLDFNVMGVGLYGCWQGFFQGNRPECLMVPLAGHPRLRTPKTLKYYSPKAKSYRRIDYVPRMFEQDSLGHVIGYAKSKGITVFPVLNSLGHNTLIPREYPEVSSLDERGRPNNYGYCTSSQKTYDLLSDLYGGIIDRYLRPHGVTWFGIGLDEVVEIAGIEPDEPERVVDPWCRCASCRSQPKPKRFLDFIVKLARFLVEKGMDKVYVFHDQLEAFGMFKPSLVRRLKREGLHEHLLFGFWDYEDRGPGVLVDLHPELDLQRWVTPMTCCFNWISFQSKIDNIWGLAARGLKANADGIMSYNFHDWGWADHFYHLSRASKASGSVCRAQVDVEYARRIFGREWKKGMTAIRLLDDYGRMVASVCGGVGAYPSPDLLQGLGANNQQRLHMMERMLGWAEQANEMLTQLRDRRSSSFARKVKQSLWAESVRTRNLLEEFVVLGRAYPKRPAEAELRRCLKLHVEIMRAIEDTKPHYLIPCNLAYLTPMYEYLAARC